MSLDPRRNQPLPPLTPASAQPCALHPRRTAAWQCIGCQRGHCDECQARTERRLTPPGTCLQCGQPLRELRLPGDGSVLAACVQAWRQAYRPLGILSAAALTLPALYGSVVFTVLVPATAASLFATWTYFLAVARARLEGEPDLPLPSAAVHDARRNMAVIPGLLALLLALAPGLAVAATDLPTWMGIACTLLAVLWLPLPIASAIATAQPLPPLLPLDALRALREDLPGYAALSLGLTLQAVALVLLGRALFAILGALPAIGHWLAATALLPGAWAIASQVGAWARAHRSTLQFEA